MSPFALLRYHIIVRTSTGATLYLLIYENEVVIPAEVEIPFLRIIKKARLSNEEWVHARYEQLMLIDEKRMVVVFHGHLYQHKIIHVFNTKVRVQTFEVAKLILKVIFSYQEKYKLKFTLN